MKDKSAFLIEKNNFLSRGPGDQHWYKMRKMISPVLNFIKIEEYTETIDLNARVRF